MYHRLAPDMVEHFSADLTSAGFTPSEVVFGDNELDLLIRGADYSEFWRERLKAIAYKTLTRVDIRRMHKLGVFETKEDLVFQYRTLGYSPENAGLMADFTIVYNAEPDRSASDEVRDLTKSEVLALVKGGQMTAEAAIEALQAIDYDIDAATAFVSLAEHQRAQKRLGDAIDIIKDSVRLGRLDYNGAISALDALDLEGMQRAEVALEIDIIAQKNIQHPSRAELDSFFEAGIISEREYKSGLGILGYSELWQERFTVQKAPGGEAVTVISDYRAGRISSIQALTQLQRLGVPDRISRELIGILPASAPPVEEVEEFEGEE
jgi:plasmid stability protein